jgi:hypothetical protein
MDLHEFIRIWRWRYLAATTVFTILLSCYVMLAKYEHGAVEIIKNFNKLRTNVSLIRAATAEMKQILATYRELQPIGYEKKTTEALLFDRLDDMKAMFPNSEITIESVKDLPDSASIPFTIKLTDYNYISFLNNLGLLSAQIFSFVSIDSISISAAGETKDATGDSLQILKPLIKSSFGNVSDRKSVVTYTIQGTVTTPKNQAGAGRQ